MASRGNSKMHWTQSNSTIQRTQSGMSTEQNPVRLFDKMSPQAQILPSMDEAAITGSKVAVNPILSH